MTGNRAVPKLAVLPAHDKMTVEQALGLCMNEARAGELKDVVILSLTATGDVRVRSSHQSRQQANWLIDQAKMHVLKNTLEE